MGRCMIMVLLAGLLSACGSGGGDGGSADDAPTAPLVGSRALPMGTLEVRQTGASTFLLTSSVPAVNAAAVLVGDDYETAVPVAVAAAGAGAWAGTATPGAHLLVRLTLTDGAVVESAPGDFALR